MKPLDMVAELRDFAQHTVACSDWMAIGGECACGLEGLLGEARRMLMAPELNDAQRVALLAINAGHVPDHSSAQALRRRGLVRVEAVRTDAGMRIDFHLTADGQSLARVLMDAAEAARP